MPNSIRIIGVHLVPSRTACHLVEIELTAPFAEFDFGLVTQEIPGQPRANWQVAYDERRIAVHGDACRWVFFFHDLTFDRPLLTPLGPIALPPPTPVPSHLKAIEYLEP